VPVEPIPDTDTAILPQPEETCIPEIQEPAFSPFDFAVKLSETLEKGTAEEALALFDTVPEEYADNFELNFLKAALLVSNSEPEKASALARELQEMQPDNIDVLVLNTMIAKTEGDTARKNSLVKEIIRLDPSNVDANVELGAEQMLRKNYPLARQYYQKAVSNDPANESALLGYGQCSYYLDLLDDSRTAFERLILINPENSFAWSYLGKLAAEDENYKRATDCILTALEYSPGYYDYWVDYGTYLRYQGKYDEAESAWTQAITLNPDYFLGYVYRSGLYDETEQFDKALLDYEKIVTLNPKYYFAYESIGMLAWYKEKWAESRAAFTKAREIQADNISYVLMIAATYMKENRLKDSKDFLAKALKTLDRNSLEYAMVRLYHDRSGDTAVVQKVLNETNRNTRGKMLYYLGLFYELNGNDVLAKKYYIEVQCLQSPMFFEYRLNDWALAGISQNMQENNTL
jgi:tetratricopeptide (TPR) repeat protein